MDKLNLFKIIKFPIVTDKASNLNLKKKTDKEKNFSNIVICVDKNSNKSQIKLAVETLFGVKVCSVNTINTHGKTKISAGKYRYKKNDTKKAIIKIVGDSTVGDFGSDASSQDKSVENFISQKDN